MFEVDRVIVHIQNLVELQVNFSKKFLEFIRKQQMINFNSNVTLKPAENFELELIDPTGTADNGVIYNCLENRNTAAFKI